MASLQVRELPRVLHEKLRLEAARHHRSIAQEAVAALEKGLGISEDPKSRRKEYVRKWRASGGASEALKRVDINRLVREDRER